MWVSSGNDSVQDQKCIKNTSGKLLPPTSVVAVHKSSLAQKLEGCSAPENPIMLQLTGQPLLPFIGETRHVAMVTVPVSERSDD